MGRCDNLIKKRDEALVERYLYWTEVARLRFDDAVKVLSEQEFFISEQRVLQVLRKQDVNPNAKYKPRKNIVKHRVLPFFKDK